MKINFVSSSSLVLANLYPIYGVYFLGWGVPKIILLFFFESVVIAFFTLLKIYYCWYETENIPIRSFNQIYKEIFKAFFIFLFWLSISFILLNILYFENTNIYNYITLSGILGMLVSHGISFYSNFIKNGEYEKTSINVMVIKVAFLRLLPIHFFIFLSSYLLNSNVGPILISLFILSKTSIDLLLHIYEHSK